MQHKKAPKDPKDATRTHVVGDSANTFSNGPGDVPIPSKGFILVCRRLLFADGNFSRARVIASVVGAVVLSGMLLFKLEDIQPWIVGSKFLRAHLIQGDIPDRYPLSNLVVFCAFLLFISHLLLSINCMFFTLDIGKLGRDYMFGRRRSAASILLGSSLFLCWVAMLITTVFATLVILSVVAECFTPQPRGIIPIATLFHWNEPFTFGVLMMFVVIDSCVVAALWCLRRSGVTVYPEDLFEAGCSILFVDFPAIVGVLFVWMITSRIFSESTNPAARVGGGGEFMTFSAGAIAIHLLLTQMIFALIRVCGHRLLGKNARKHDTELVECSVK